MHYQNTLRVPIMAALLLHSNVCLHMNRYVRVPGLMHLLKCENTWQTDETRLCHDNVNVTWP